ncbi:MAG TPA: Clp protease N-terminal domain-containing protein [Acidimicrobiales bacterium]|nr:Clp protease N-terminal domain-containing protein [Acidimicrobiales bacterium]
MFERLTGEAREALGAATDEAAGLGHGFLGTEHLLVGLLHGDGIAALVLTGAGVTRDMVRDEVRSIIGTDGIDPDALAAIGIELDTVRQAVEHDFGAGAFDRVLGRGRRRCGDARPMTPRLKKVMELALREALSMRHGYIGTEHLLLGLLREGKGVGAQVISRLAPDVDLRAAVLARLRQAS